MPEPETPPVPAVRQPDPELDQLARLGKWLAASESDSKSPDALGASAALRFYYARHLGLPPMAAAELSVIRGRLYVQAKLLRALAATRGYRVERVDEENACTAILRDAVTGDELARSRFTMEQAKKAGLVKSGGAWESYPERMLWSKASKYVLDDNAPEVTIGLLIAEERDEIEGTAEDNRDSNYDLEAEGIPWPDEPAPEPVTATVDEHGTTHVRQEAAL